MAERKEKSNKNTAAALLYKPFGIASGIAGGLVAGTIFKQVWKRMGSDEKPDAPRALESEYDVREVLVAAAIQGLIFALVKAAIDRGGARVFERWTGEWPGD